MVLIFLARDLKYINRNSKFKKDENEKHRKISKEKESNAIDDSREFTRIHQLHIRNDFSNSKITSSNFN